MHGGGAVDADAGIHIDHAKISKGDNCKACVSIFRYFVDEEQKLLEARKVLRDIFIFY